MADNISVYNGSPTAGAADGTLVSAGNPIQDGDLQIGADREGTPVRLAVRAVSGKQRLGTFPVAVGGASADCWALAPDNAGVPGTWGAWGATLTLAGPITAANTVFWAKPRVKATEVVTPPGALSMDDTSVSMAIPTDVSAVALTAPVFLAGPTVTPGNLTVTLAATWGSGGDGEAVTAKRIVKTSSSVPVSGDWTAAASFTSPETITGLVAGTPVYAWVQITDLTGNKVVSTMVTTTPTAVNVAPTFSAAATVTAITSTGCTVTATATDNNGTDVLSYKVAVTASASVPSDWSGYTSKTHAQMIAGVAVTGLAESTSYYAHVQVDDGNGHLVVSSSAQFSTTAAGSAAVFTNDFALGQAVDTANVGTSVAGGGTATVASNKLTLVSTTEGMAACAFFKTKVDKTKTRTYERKFTVTALMADVPAPILSLQDHPGTDWAVGTNTVINAQNRSQLLFVDPSTDLPYLAASYVDSAGVIQGWDTSLNTGAGGWTAAVIDAFAKQFGQPVLGTAYIAQMVTTATGVKWAIRSATGTLIRQTTEVPWASIKTPSSDLWVTMGDYFNNYYFSTQETLHLKITEP